MIEQTIHFVECDFFKLNPIQETNMITGYVTGDSIRIMVLLEKPDVAVNVDDVLKNGIIVGKFNKGEYWRYRTDPYTKDDGILYLVGISVSHDCVTELYKFIPSTESCFFQMCQVILQF